MTQSMMTAHHSNDHNDLYAVENIVYPVFSCKTHEQARIYGKIRSTILSVFEKIGITAFQRAVFWWYVSRSIRKGFRKNIPLIQVEERLRKFVRRVSSDKKAMMADISLRRSQQNFQGIKSYIDGQRILDLGSGDGLLALTIKNDLKKEVILADVVDYNQSGLPLIIYEPETALPLKDNEVDTTILYTVLHHSQNPAYLLKEAARVTSRRLIIKEVDIEQEGMRMVNGFVDWFYNRIIGDEDISVPLNFLTVKEWAAMLLETGFKIIKTDFVGIDEEAVPERHVIIIAEK